MAKWRFDGPLMRNLDGFDERAKRAMVAGAGYAAPQIQSFMKANAPWTDRTGNARSGLKTTVRTDGDKVAIVLYHSVPYGPFLEVRWGGKFGVIPDSIAYGGPLFIETVGRLMFS